MEFCSVPAELLRALLREISRGDQPQTVSFSFSLFSFPFILPRCGGGALGREGALPALHGAAPGYLPQVLPELPESREEAFGAGKGRFAAL